MVMYFRHTHTLACARAHTLSVSERDRHTDKDTGTETKTKTEPVGGGGSKEERSGKRNSVVSREAGSYHCPLHQPHRKYVVNQVWWTV